MLTRYPVDDRNLSGGAFDAIINAPQAGILGLGRIRTVPEWREGDEVMDHLGEVDTQSIRENLAFLNLTVAGYTKVSSCVVDQDLDRGTTARR